MPSIIQFFHPGKEHGPDTDDPTIKSWNTDSHKRKFLSVQGDYLTRDETLVTDKNIMLWGEWEPDSQVKEFNTHDGNLPRYMHFPYIRNPLPNRTQRTGSQNTGSCNSPGCNAADPNGESWQNTDPFIFGDNFKYAICRQRTKYSDFRIQDLEAGTIIVFGSLSDKQDSTFTSIRIDTVFVVSSHFIDKQTLLTMKDTTLSTHDKTYFDISFRMAFPTNEDFPDDNKLYTGVTYKDRNKYHEMFSFVPAMPCSTDMPEKGFPRIEMPLFHETNQPITPFMVKENVTDNECATYWKELKEKALSHSGCIATRVGMPERGK